HRRARRGGGGRGVRGRGVGSRGWIRGRIAGNRQPEGSVAMNHLLRTQAPIGDAGWTLLDEEARERLAPALAARKLVDFSGPRGWEHSATNLGRTSPLASSPSEGVSGLQRRVPPPVELPAGFAPSRAALRGADRGAGDPDPAPLDHGAHPVPGART